MNFSPQDEAAMQREQDAIMDMQERIGAIMHKYPDCEDKRAAQAVAEALEKAYMLLGDFS